VAIDYDTVDLEESRAARMNRAGVVLGVVLSFLGPLLPSAWADLAPGDDDITLRLLDWIVVVKAPPRRLAVGIPRGVHSIGLAGS